MKLTTKRFRKNNEAASPAFSTMILTAGAVVMILVAMTYASDILNLKVAENEFASNKQFMSTTGQQLDDVAWTIGRTQTVEYTSRFGTLRFEEAALTYNIDIHTSSGWRNQTITTGIALYNMPVSSYELSDGYFERVPRNANASIIQFGSTAPVSKVFCEEKLNMDDGSYVRVVLVPTIRYLTSTAIGSYYKFYLPNMQHGSSPYISQTLTVTGAGIEKTTQANVDQVVIRVEFPKAAAGFDADFFKFQDTSVTLNTVPAPGETSTVEAYSGQVTVSIGAT